MRYILSKACHPILTRLVRERTLCAFDFDGTLAPIVEHPDQAMMRDRTRDLLIRLAGFYPCIVISGRARADVLVRLRGVKVSRVIGNHGAETGTITRNQRRRVQAWKDVLDTAVKPFTGVWVEDKGLSLAVHYRQSNRKAEARHSIVQAAGSLRSSRIVGGKEVVNVLPDRSPNKGGALETERRRLGCDRVLYVGDDENDEDAFALSGDIVAVRIGRMRQSHAGFYLRNQSQIDDLLSILLTIHETPDRGVKSRICR